MFLMSRDGDKGSGERAVEAPCLHNGVGVAAGGEHLPAVSTACHPLQARAGGKRRDGGGWQVGVSYCDGGAGLRGDEEAVGMMNKVR